MQSRTVDFKTGDRVIVRSNEEEPLLIGIIIDFENFNNPKNDWFPVVVEEGTDNQFVCMGIVKPYSDELMKELKTMTPKEQWNYLAKAYTRV